MSVPNQTPYNIYTANGLTTVFAYEFMIMTAGDIEVSINGTPQTSGYAVQGAGQTGGGQVEFLTPPANGSVVMLLRNLTIKRDTEYQDNGDLLAETINADFDRLWLAMQQAFLSDSLSLKRPLLGGPYNAGNLKIINLKDPTDKQDAATKGWVDLQYSIPTSEAKQAAAEAKEARDESREIADKFGDVDGAITAAESARDDARGSANSASVDAERAESAADSAEAKIDIEGTYPDVATGLANTTEGQYFRVPQGVGAERSFIYYQNVGGIAVPGADQPGYGAIKRLDAKLPEGNYKPSFFPLRHDRNRKVPIWLDNSRLDAADLGPVLRSVVENIPNAWAQYYLRQFGFKTSFFPAWFDLNGKVPAWFDNSRFDVAGLGPNIQSLIKNLVGVDSSGSFVEGDQYKFTFKRGRIAAGVAASLNVGFGMDSWGEKSTISQALINILGGGYKDPGYISCSTRTDGVMAGITLVVTNFTKYDGDNENNNAPPPYGSGPDGNAYWNNNKVGTLTWSNVTATDLSLFYFDSTGNFTVAIDGGAPVTITGTNSGTVKKYDITGLTATAHTVVVTSSGTGVVSILCMYGKNSAKTNGITVSRMGNGGAMAKDYLHWQDYITPIVTHFDLDLFFMILGTNDFRKSAGIAEFVNGLQVVIDKYKAATPGICICLVSAAQSNATGTPALSEYDEAMRTLAIENNVNFISLYQLFPKTYDNSGGAWADALHLSDRGAYVLARKIKDEFFKE